MQNTRRLITYVVGLSVAALVTMPMVASMSYNTAAATDFDGDVVENPWDHIEDSTNSGDLPIEDETTTRSSSSDTETTANRQPSATSKPDANKPAANKPSNDAKKTTPVKAGQKFTIKKTNLRYKITNVKKRTVQLVLSTNKKRVKAVVPATVSYQGRKYKVTAIAANAFKNNKKLKSVTIGANVTTIGKNAFYNCKKLAKITIKSKKLKKVAKTSFKKINAKARIKVPKKKLKAYKKLLKNKGLGKNAKIIK